VSTNWQLVGPLLDHLARRLRAASESVVEQFGLRARHVIALTLLRDFGERQQSDLAGVLRIDPTNLVGLLNELEEAGLIERRRSTQDRRRHTVALTAAGSKRLAEIEEMLLEVERRLLGALDDEQHALLYQLLQRAAGDTAVCTEPAAGNPCLADQQDC
ncbi:MAG: MarR family winged helix-turn-helix transcriptional regulator, partial [Mycobacterium sp.]